LDLRGSMKRLMIFIDNTNIFRGSREEKLKFDYQKLRNTSLGYISLTENSSKIS